MNQQVMLKKIKKMQDEMVATQKEIEQTVFTASAGGVVSIEMYGSKELKAVKFVDGFKPEDALDAAVKISELKNISLVGLMCIPPLANEPEDNREFFRGLREYKDKINSLGIDGLKLTELSMGMTNDYECAIEEGASYIRIGTAIFGARDYSAKQ